MIDTSGTEGDSPKTAAIHVLSEAQSINDWLQSAVPSQLSYAFPSCSIAPGPDEVGSAGLVLVPVSAAITARLVVEVAEVEDSVSASPSFSLLLLVAVVVAVLEREEGVVGELGEARGVVVTAESAKSSAAS